MYNNNFLGKNGFIWFNGVVEDRNDPQKLGAVCECVAWVFIRRIRKNYQRRFTVVAGYSPDYKWAFQDLAHSKRFIVEGSWVFGYFRDGEMCPRTNGNRYITVARLSAETDKGFYDPNGVYPKYKDEVDTNRLQTLMIVPILI